ncbi:hypothetical protein [Aeromonas sp. MR16]|uniref:hypothetical protein n=1 Tax=Aeromonas sp. MR16 TaxID=2923420 RepID=UPI001F4ADE24|nr:hypothetical protein [Aeromonas sp. MR16]MCH7373436.1 hypothetical protein [Aeromonas sp. MR16]
MASIERDWPTTSSVLFHIPILILAGASRSSTGLAATSELSGVVGVIGVVGVVGTMGSRGVPGLRESLGLLSAAALPLSSVESVHADSPSIAVIITTAILDLLKSPFFSMSKLHLNNELNWLAIK